MSQRNTERQDRQEDFLLLETDSVALEPFLKLESLIIY